MARTAHQAHWNAEFTYSDVGCYEVGLLITSDAGCSDATSLVVCVEDEFAAYIPNAFTPNGDGFNDLFGVITTVGAPRSFELDVFDRWGASSLPPRTSCSCGMAP